MKNVLIILVVFCPSLLWAQSDRELHFSGYLETYYSYDFNQPESHSKPEFINQFNRHNEININLTYLQAYYKNSNIRAKIGLMAGTCSQKIHEESPQWAKFIYQANIGVKLDDGFWLDVGIMPSHFGSEGQVGKENWSLSPSILAENAPYYFTGARLTYDKINHWKFLLWLNNGWQKIQKPDRVQSLGIGAGVSYEPTSKVRISYNNYLANEAPQTMKLFRFFNNIYAQYEWGQWGAKIRMDYGLEDHPFSSYNEWWGIMANLRRVLNKHFILGLRGEYFGDNKGVIVDASKLSGYSLNLDYKVAENALARVEVRTFHSPEALFEKPAGKLSQSNTALNMSLSIGL